MIPSHPGGSIRSLGQLWAVFIPLQADCPAGAPRTSTVPWVSGKQGRGGDRGGKGTDVEDRCGEAWWRGGGEIRCAGQVWGTDTRGQARGQVGGWRGMRNRVGSRLWRRQGEMGTGEVGGGTGCRRGQGHGPGRRGCHPPMNCHLLENPPGRLSLFAQDVSLPCWKAGPRDGAHQPTCEAGWALGERGAGRGSCGWGGGLLTRVCSLWSCRARQRARLSVSPAGARANLTWFEFLSE